MCRYKAKLLPGGMKRSAALSALMNSFVRKLAPSSNAHAQHAEVTKRDIDAMVGCTESELLMVLFSDVRVVQDAGEGGKAGGKGRGKGGGKEKKKGSGSKGGKGGRNRTG